MLADVFAEVASKLTGVTCWLGLENLARAESPPRMVWIPTQEKFDGAQRHAQAGSQQAMAPRTLFTRGAGVQCHLWATGDADDTDPYKELRATELLLNRVIWCLHQVAWGSYSVNGGQWLAANVGHLGRGYLLDLMFRMPVTPASADSGVALATLDTASMTGTHVSNPTTTPTGDVTGTPAP